MLIYNNPWLMQELIKIGQGKTLTETVSPQQTQVNMALKLLDQLQKDFSPIDPNKPAEISTQSGNPVSLKPTALESIGALAAFLSQNKITVNGKVPVYDHDPGQEDYHFYRLEGNALYAEPADRSTNKTGLWINPELLSSYIVSLQAQNATKPNQVLATYLATLIQESNKLLGTKVNPTYQSSIQLSHPKGQGQQLGEQGKTDPTASVKAPQTSLTELVAMTPFNSQYIDFNEIMQFVSSYLTLAGSRIGQKNTSALQQEASQMQTSIGMAQNILNTGGGTIQLSNMTPENFKMMCKNGNQAKLLANYLYTIISMAGSIYQDFVTQFGRIIENSRDPGLGSSGLQAIQQQIGPGGPQQNNLSLLKRMMSML